MYSFFRIFFCMVSMALAACTSHHVLIKKRVDLKICQTHCKERLMRCSRVCRNNCQDCTKATNCAVQLDYNRYRQELLIAGGMLARDLNSFRDPLQCRKTTCNCISDYNVCMQSCKGLIYKQLKVPTACC